MYLKIYILGIIALLPHLSNENLILTNYLYTQPKTNIGKVALELFNKTFNTGFNFKKRHHIASFMTINEENLMESVQKKTIQKKIHY